MKQAVLLKEISLFTSRPELSILKYVKENPDLFSDMGSDFVDKVSNFKNTFLGVDLGVIPTIHPDTWSKAAVSSCYDTDNIRSCSASFYNLFTV